MRADPLIQKQLRELPHKPGVYLFKDGSGSVIYVGKAKDLSKRVRSYFDRKRLAAEGRPKVMAMVRWIRRIDTIIVKNEAEALILEGRLLKEYKPKYNTSFVDDKRFLLIRLDAAELPRFTLCRTKNDPQSSYYGPFVHGAAAKKIFYELRRRYGVLLSDGNPKKLSDGRFRLYDDARAEIYNLSDIAKDEASGQFPLSQNGNIVTRQAYLQRVVKACAFLEGKAREVREELIVKMQEAAESFQYEKAAQYRDLYQAIEFARNPQKKFLVDPMMKLLHPQKAMEALQEALKAQELPDSIECFDISHISGSFAVASLVRFEGGKPAKKGYKRFKIKSFEGNDDFRAMREVVGRHYKRLVDEGKPLPKIILIDGGVGQVKSALAALIEEGVWPTGLEAVKSPQSLLMGLAKRDETFVFSDGRAPLTLPREHEGLRLLQRVRDEAHRFANSYNADLRSKKIKSSLLDEIPGLGPKRREQLLAKFGTLERVKKANKEELAGVVGPSLAEKLVSFFTTRDSASHAS